MIYDTWGIGVIGSVGILNSAKEHSLVSNVHCMYRSTKRTSDITNDQSPRARHRARHVRLRGAHAKQYTALRSLRQQQRAPTGTAMTSERYYRPELRNLPAPQNRTSADEVNGEYRRVDQISGVCRPGCAIDSDHGGDTDAGFRKMPVREGVENASIEDTDGDGSFAGRVAEIGGRRYR